MRLLRESVLILALGLSLSSTAAPGEESFAVKYRAYPWHVWNSPVYKQAFTWSEFRKKVAELNGLPDNDKAFRHLKRGTELKVPALPGAVASKNEIAMAKREQLDIDEVRFKAERDLWAAEKGRLEKALNEAVGAMYKNLAFWVAALGAFFIGAGATWFLTKRYYEGDPDSAEIRKLKADNTHLRHQLRDREAQDHFLRLYTHEFEVPEHIGKVFGKTRYVYLQKADPIEGEDAVLVFGESLPVKVRNLKRFFYDAQANKPHVLEYYKITKSDKDADTVATGRIA